MEQHQFLCHGTRAHLQDRQVDLIHQHLNFLLHLVPHAREHEPENLTALFKHRQHTAHGIPADAQAQVLLHGLHERRLATARRAVEAHRPSRKHVHVLLQHALHRAKSEQLRAHRVRLHVPLAL